MDQWMTFLQHAIFIIFVNLSEIIDEEYRQNNNDYNKHNAHNKHLILLFDQERRQRNTHIERSCPLRISVFETVLFSCLVG
jgi:hypothetical protein